MLKIHLILRAPHTTRKPKASEMDRQNFNFIKMEEFEQDVTQVIQISSQRFRLFTTKLNFF